MDGFLVGLPVNEEQGAEEYDDDERDQCDDRHRRREWRRQRDGRRRRDERDADQRPAGQMASHHWKQNEKLDCKKIG